MKQNEQSEADHKRFLFVKKRLKRAAALAGILIIALSLSGCENFVETDVGAETKITNQTVSETTIANYNEKKNLQTINYKSEYKEFPKGWSSERVLNMVSVDGYQLSFPCTIDDILDLSDDFQIKDEMYHSETQKLAFLYYKDTEIATIGYYNDKKMYYANFDDFYKSGYVTIENININETEKMMELMKTLISVSENKTELVGGKYTDKKVNLHIEFYSSTSKSSYSTNDFVLYWEELK